MPLVESSFRLIARDQIFVSFRNKGDSVSGVVSKQALSTLTMKIETREICTEAPTTRFPSVLSTSIKSGLFNPLFSPQFGQIILIRKYTTKDQSLVDEKTQSLRLASFSLCKILSEFFFLFFFFFAFIPTGIIHKWRLNKKLFLSVLTYSVLYLTPKSSY